MFWHTQGSGKSYSMAFFAEKVRRVVPGNFTFLVMTDREDLDDQIWRTFIGCGVTDEKTPRAGSGKELQEILRGNHRFVFSLIHKFNQPVTEPYSERDDIIVISDEAHRTQAGKFARNMRLALPNASFIGFTGTPLFKHDELTRRIFGGYVSRYDFKRSEEDQSTVKLVYENRGEKLGIARLDLNDRIADAIEQAELDPDQEALLEKLLGKDYEVITADDRLDKLADDFVEHCSTRWQTGKSMLVCIDKITCARMFQRIEPRWKAKLARGRGAHPRQGGGAGRGHRPGRAGAPRQGARMPCAARRSGWKARSSRSSSARRRTRSATSQKWGFDIIPHRVVMKTGFQTPDGKRVPVEDAFKDPQHPFRIAIVCAMWLTGFDVECLATLYIDKPMKAHNLMQAIARANRVFPGKDCGVIVDYNGMLKSLREALAQYALGDDDEGGEGGGIVAPIEELVAALLQAIEAAEKHLLGSGLRSGPAARRDRVRPHRSAARRRGRALHVGRGQAPVRDHGAAGVHPLQGAADGAECPGLRRAPRQHRGHLQEAAGPARYRRRDRGAQGAAPDRQRGNPRGGARRRPRRRAHGGPEPDRLRQAARRVRRARCGGSTPPCRTSATSSRRSWRRCSPSNPMRMDYYKKYQEIIADYNREKDRVTVEETFAQLVELAASLDAEQRRAAEEGLTDDELALFDLLFKESISKADRERLKQASKGLLASLHDAAQANAQTGRKNSATQAEVKMFILDNLWRALPRPPFTDEETEEAAARIYEYVWQLTAAGHEIRAA